METVATHILLELHGVRPALLDDVAALKSALLDAARAARTTPLHVAEHKFEPQGASVVVLVAESHLSIHTWPELGYAAVDIFTCGAALPVHGVAPILQALKPERHELKEIPRGPRAAPPVQTPVAGQKSKVPA
ncbi:MAG: adenosylmethionine decarboxylase [Myxococcota bacterium]